MRSPKVRLCMIVAGAVLSLVSPSLARQRDSSFVPRSPSLTWPAPTSTLLPVLRFVTTTSAVVGAVGSRGAVTSLPALGRAATAVAFALAQLGKPYRFGTAGPAAFDCSGLTRAAYLTVGLELPHHASYQARLGEAVAWDEPGAVRAGDLVFVRGGRPRHDLGHVGLAVSATEWVQAPAPGQVVRRDPIPFARIQAVRRIVPG